MSKKEYQYIVRKVAATPRNARNSGGSESSGSTLVVPGGGSGPGPYSYLRKDREDSTNYPVDFLKGLKVNGLRIYEQDGLIYIDGSLAVTGGITAFAQGSLSAATIMDAVAVDGTTITKRQAYRHRGHRRWHR